MKFKVDDVVIFYRYDGSGGVNGYKEGDICTIVSINTSHHITYCINVIKKDKTRAQLGVHEIKLIESEQERLNYKYGVI